MNIILLLIGLLNLGLLIYLFQRSDATQPDLREMLEDHEDHLTDQLDYRFEKERQASQIANQQLEIALTDRLTEMRVEIHQQTTALRAERSMSILPKIGTRQMSACARFKSLTK